MPSQSYKQSNREPQAADFDGGGFAGHLKMAQQALATSPVRTAADLGRHSVFGVIVATAVGQILLNRWNQPFFDAIERRDRPALPPATS